MVRVYAAKEKTGLGSTRTLIAESMCFLWTEMGCHGFALNFAHECNWDKLGNLKQRETEVYC